MKTIEEEEKESGNGFAKKLRKGGRGITLKFDGECADCGAFLSKGTTARWYGRGRLYGYTCHASAGASDQAKKVGVVEDKPAQDEMDFDPAEINPWENEGGKSYDCTIH